MLQYVCYQLLIALALVLALLLALVQALAHRQILRYIITSINEIGNKLTAEEKGALTATREERRQAALENEIVTVDLDTAIDAFEIDKLPTFLKAKSAKLSNIR